MKRERVFRGAFYVTGEALTALGSTLSPKAGLGVSPPTAVPFAIYNGTGFKFSVMCFVVSSLMIVLQFILRGKNSRKRDLLQLPLNVMFSVFLEWFDTLFTLHPMLLWQKLLVMALSIVCTGSGVFLMVNMHLVPNPPDGLTQVLSEVLNKELGITKNLFDFTCVAIAVLVDILLNGRLLSIGLGTVVAMVFIGRTVSLLNHIFRGKLLALAGLK